MKPRMDLRRIGAVTFLPLVLLGVYVLAMRIHGLVRYDPAYFTAPYLEKYQTSGSVARVLEKALQTGDKTLFAELQGRRRPAPFVANPNVSFVMLSEYTDRYLTYVYVDRSSYERYPHYIEQVKGRWVVAAPDLYFYMNSGRWQAVFLPLALAWWALEGIILLGILVARLVARWRERTFEG
jgi:hypothetical protein